MQRAAQKARYASCMSRRAPARAKMIVFLTFVLGLVVEPTHSARETVTFDFGWRWRLGLHATPLPGGPPEPPTSGPGPNPTEARSDFDDSSWAPVHLPHDGLIAQGASNISCPTGCSGRSFIPRHVMWYRKTFSFPAAWGSVSADSSAWLEFDGIFHAAIVYLNGNIVARNAEGYLGFHVQLDNATGLLRPPGEKNVLAVFVDPDGGAGFSQLQRSGWWYEGSGIYRHARMVTCPDPPPDLNSALMLLSTAAATVRLGPSVTAGAPSPSSSEQASPVGGTSSILHSWTACFVCWRTGTTGSARGTAPSPECPRDERFLLLRHLPHEAGLEIGN